MEPQEKEKRETNLYKIDQTEEVTAPSIVDYEEIQPDRLANKMESTVPDPRVSKMAPAPDILVPPEERTSCNMEEVTGSARLNSSDDSLQVRRVLTGWQWGVIFLKRI